MNTSEIARKMIQSSIEINHDHTLTSITGLDHQILVEADYLVNAMRGCIHLQHRKNI